MSLVIQSNVTKSLEATLDTVWGDEMKGSLVWESCGFKVGSTKKAWVDDQEYAGLGAMPEKEQGATMAIDSIQEGYSKRYVMRTFALRMVVSEEALADCQYEKAIDGAGNTARAAKWTQEYEAANVFIRAFTAAYPGADGLELCSTAHLLPKGGTYSNEFSTPMSLSETAVETMSVNLSKMPGSNGIPRGYALKKLVIPEDLKFRAARILKSEQQNDTANNAVNVLKGMGIEIATNKYLTSTTNWFGVTDAQTGLRFIWRERPKFGKHNTEDNLTATFRGYQRFDVGWSDPRGVYGSAI